MATARLTSISLFALLLISLPAPAAERAQLARKDPKASVREGRRLFLESGCMACHSVGGKGGVVGPTLDGVGRLYPRSYIEGKIRDPQAHPSIVDKGKRAGKAKNNSHKKLASKMIQADLFDDEIKSLADYLITLPPPQAKPRTP